MGFARCPFPQTETALEGVGFVATARMWRQVLELFDVAPAQHNEGPVIREILGHLGEPISAPPLAPARSPPLWELPLAGQAERETDPQAQPAPDYEFDQCVAWQERQRQGLRLVAVQLVPGRVRFPGAILV